MKYSDPDWTPPEQWDDGIPGLLLDYNLSGQLGKQNHNNNTAQNLSSYGTLGANMGAWRLRATTRPITISRPAIAAPVSTGTRSTPIARCRCRPPS